MPNDGAHCRREFSATVRRQAWARCGGRCEGPLCGGVKLFPGRFTFDHDNPDALGGEPTLENCRVLCDLCNGKKTSDDVRRIRKADRQTRAIIGKPPSKRPMPHGKNSPTKRTFGGQVIPRQPRKTR